jgi:hypothetical protein
VFVVVAGMSGVPVSVVDEVSVAVVRDGNVAAARAVLVLVTAVLIVAGVLAFVSVAVVDLVHVPVVDVVGVAVVRDGNVAAALAVRVVVAGVLAVGWSAHGTFSLLCRPVRPVPTADPHALGTNT